MRRWLPRSLWLIAWSLWGWLGWGLYRELPRDLGPPLAHLISGAKLSLDGFLGGKPALVGELYSAPWFLADRERTIHCWDAQTGRELAQTGPFHVSRWAPDEPRLSLTHGVAIEGDESQQGSARRYKVWDLQTGIARALPEGFSQLLDLHATRPWALLGSERDQPTKVAIADLGTGALIRAWDLSHAVPVKDALVHAGFFDDSDESLLVVLRTSVNSREWLIRLGTDSAVSSAVALARDYHRFGPPQGGRLVASAWEEEDAIDEVLDCATGRAVWSSVAQGDAAIVLALGAPSIILAARGTRVYCPTTGLTDIASGATVWAPESGAEDSFLRLAGTNAFWVRETWPVRLRRLTSGTLRTTWALRSLDDGRLIVRLWEQVCLNDTRTLAATHEGAVYAWPASANYLLFALCQSILALPLLLTWLALRWRRIRHRHGAVRSAAPEAVQ